MCAQTASVYPQAKPFVNGDLTSVSDPAADCQALHPQRGWDHPHRSVYFGTEGENIVVGTQEMTRKVANIRQQTLASLYSSTWWSRSLKGVIVYGIASLEVENVIPRRVAIFRKYKDEVGAQALAERLVSTWTPVIIRIKPEQTITFDYGQGFGISANGGEESGEGF